MGIDQKLVECVVQQTVRAPMQQPLNTLEWCYMVLSLFEGHQTKGLLDWTTPNLRRGNGKKLLSKLEEFLDKYTEHSQVKAYDMQAPPAKRPHRRRTGQCGSPAAKDDGTEASVKNGKGTLGSYKTS